MRQYQSELIKEACKAGLRIKALDMSSRTGFRSVGCGGVGSLGTLARLAPFLSPGVRPLLVYLS